MILKQPFIPKLLRILLTLVLFFVAGIGVCELMFAADSSAVLHTSEIADAANDLPDVFTLTTWNVEWFNEDNIGDSWSTHFSGRQYDRFVIFRNSPTTILNARTWSSIA